MKKFFTFLSTMGFISLGFAQVHGRDNNGMYANYKPANNYASSALVVNANTAKRFTVMVDNFSYPANGYTANVGALNEGRHTIAVYECKTGFWGNKKEKLIYNATLFFKPNVEVTINLNNHNRANVVERELFQNKNRDYHRWDDRR